MPGKYVAVKDQNEEERVITRHLKHHIYTNINIFSLISHVDKIREKDRGKTFDSVWTEEA